MSKRQKFVLSAVILSIAFLVTGTQEIINRFVGVFAISIASVLLFSWCLSETLRRNATLLVLVLPALFTFGVGSFWFLLPSSVLTRIPVVILYGIGLYALGLTANIYTVSTIRSIALFRAAKSVGFVITLFTSFLLNDAIFSLKAGFFLNIPMLFITAIGLVLPGLWVSTLDTTLSKKQIVYSVVISACITLIGCMLFFWPSSVVITSLFVTVSLYVLLGLAQAQIEGRLFASTMREYLLVGIIVFIAMTMSTSWRG